MKYQLQYESSLFIMRLDQNRVNRVKSSQEFVIAWRIWKNGNCIFLSFKV